MFKKKRIEKCRCSAIYCIVLSPINGAATNKKAATTTTTLVANCSSMRICFQTNHIPSYSNKLTIKQEREETDGGGKKWTARKCFYFTAIIRMNKYKYHIVCDWKSILLLNIYKWRRKGSVGGRKIPGTGHSWCQKRRINFIQNATA